MRTIKENPPLKAEGFSNYLSIIGEEIQKPFRLVI